MTSTAGQILIFHGPDGRMQVQVRLEDGTV